MMKLLIVLACLVAYCAASECGTLQRLKVKKQWTQAFGVSEDREAMGLAVWRYIFHKRPEVVDQFFKRVNGHDMHSPEFLAHSGRVLSGFDMMIALLCDEDVLHHELEHLEHQHAEMHIPAEMFDIFSQALRLAVHSLLGRCYDEEAWASCTDVLENGIKSHDG